jgi:hypothetical protein
MYYRIHDENDSNIEDTVGGIALLNYIAKKGIGNIPQQTHLLFE